MANDQHSSYLSSKSFRYNGNRIEQTVLSDVSAEVVLEALVRVHINSNIIGRSPSQKPLNSRFRKRLANVRQR